MMKIFMIRQCVAMTVALLILTACSSTTPPVSAPIPVLPVPSSVTPSTSTLDGPQTNASESQAVKDTVDSYEATVSSPDPTVSTYKKDYAKYLQDSMNRYKNTVVINDVSYTVVVPQTSKITEDTPMRFAVIPESTPVKAVMFAEPELVVPAELKIKKGKVTVTNSNDMTRKVTCDKTSITLSPIMVTCRFPDGTPPTGSILQFGFMQNQSNVISLPIPVNPVTRKTS